MTDDAVWVGAVALTSQEDHAFGVATDGVHVVFSTGGSQVGENAVRMVPLDASAPSTVLVANPAGLIPSGALAIYSDDVYVGAGRSILRVPLTGGDATVLAADRPADITSIAVDETGVFWTTSALNRPDDAELAMMPLVGGEVVALGGPAIGHGSYSSVALDGNGGAFAGSAGGIVHGRPGAPAIVVVSAEQATGAVTRIAFDGALLYGIVAGGRGGLFCTPAAPGGGGGGDLLRLARRANDTGAVAPIAAGAAYFDGDALMYVGAAGGDPVVVARGRYPEGSLAAIDNRLVFPADWQLWVASVSG